jgi:hypothetical protein
MIHFLASFGSFPWQSFLGKAPMESDSYLLRLFYLLCGLVGIAFGVFRRLQAQAQKEASRPRPAATIAPGEIASVVAGLAHSSLGIGSHQVNESMEKLRIPRGDFLRFLDDLEVDHDLSVPASARAMSTSISGVIAALCQRI